LVQGSEHEKYYLGRSSVELQAIIAATLKGAPPMPDHDIDQSYLVHDALIDPYKGTTPDYRAVRAALAARDASLSAAIKHLGAKPEWTLEMLEEFRVAALRQMRVDFDPSPIVRKAARCWQTEDDWAKGPELGGWSISFLMKSATPICTDWGRGNSSGAGMARCARRGAQSAAAGIGRPRLYRGKR
jgi:hypothetical protein